jgi:hypothetical protein
MDMVESAWLSLCRKTTEEIAELVGSAPETVIRVFAAGQPASTNFECMLCCRSREIVHAVIVRRTERRVAGALCAQCATLMRLSQCVAEAAAAVERLELSSATATIDEIDTVRRRLLSQVHECVALAVEVAEDV